MIKVISSSFNVFAVDVAGASVMELFVEPGS
jgi:hypothetical protein